MRVISKLLNNLKLQRKYIFKNASPVHSSFKPRQVFNESWSRAHERAKDVVAFIPSLRRTYFIAIEKMIKKINIIFGHLTTF